MDSLMGCSFKSIDDLMGFEFKPTDEDVNHMDSLMGFRFKPTDDEIIFLLTNKRLDPDFSVRAIQEIDINKYEPWELPGLSVIQPKEEVWYFFYKPCKYAKSDRSHRRTKTGYWKVTGNGSDMKAKNSGKVIGKKKILPFYSYDAEKAKTEWVMHEITVEDNPSYKEDFVVGRLERKQDTKLVTKRGIKRDTKPVRKRGVKSPKKRRIYEDQSSQDLASRNRVAENILQESILPSNQFPIVLVDDHLRNHVAENTCAESHLLPSHHAADEEFNPHGSCNGVNNAMQSPIHPEQEPLYCNGSSYGYEALNSQSYSENSSPRAFQNESSSGESGQTFASESNPSKCDESSREATGQTSSPEFNLSNSDGVDNGMDAETFMEWVELQFE